MSMFILPPSAPHQRPIQQTLSLSEVENEQDIYSQERFGVIKRERFENGSDFYICVAQSYGKTFFFEGSKFVEDFVKRSEHDTSLYHPLTRERVTSLRVLKATQYSSDYIEVFDQNSVMHHVNCLPILLSDSSISNNKKGVYYFMLAECYRNGKNCDVDLDLAISYFYKSAQLGNRDAQFNLSVLLGNKGHIRESIYWALKPWENFQIKDIPVNGLINIGNCFERLNYHEQALPFYKEAACRGNFHGIAKVIRYYDLGLGVRKSPEMIALWRKFIPPRWQCMSSFEYLKYTCDSKLNTHEQHINLPEQLQREHRPLSLPNPDDFPEKNTFYAQMLWAASNMLSMFKA